MTEIPHSEEAEKGALGSMLIDPHTAISESVEKINEHYFVNPVNRTIYSTVVDLWNKGRGIDLITFTQHLRDLNQLDSVGGASYVTDLFTFVPSAANVGYYLDILRDKYVLRELITISNESAQGAYGDLFGEKINDLIAQAQNKLSGLQLSLEIREETVEELAGKALEQISSACEKGGVIPGLSTGLVDLDQKFGGMRPGQLIVIAGETSQGKTGLGLRIIEETAIKNQIPSAYFSLEMSGVELSERLIAMISKIDLHQLITKGGSDDDIQRVVKAAEKLKESKLFIRCDVQTPALAAAAAQQLKLKEKIQLIVVDYIQLFSIDGDEGREREMSETARLLKRCAHDQNLVVIALSQVNDEGKLRDSRAIGHHADKVVFIKHDDDSSWLNVRKNRNGPTGGIPVTFVRSWATFENRANKRETNE